MGIAQKLEVILRKQLACHAAWLPIANTFALGDYGLVSSGVFTKMGNVKEFNGEFTVEESPAVKLDFASAGTTVASFVGDAEVKVLPPTAVNATVRYRFDEAESFLLKAASVRVSAIGNLNALMQSMKRRREWERRFSVVRQVWTAADAAVLSTLKQGTEVTFGGDAPALQQLGLGKASASLSVGTTKELGLKLVGQTGVIGLSFAKFDFFGTVTTLSAGGQPDLLEHVSDQDALADDL